MNTRAMCAPRMIYGGYMEGLTLFGVLFMPPQG